MSESWTIRAGGRGYGPYTAEQMHAFQAEGRLAVHSLVAPEGDDQFRPAGEYPELASLFANAPQDEIPQTAPLRAPAAHRFGGGEGGHTGERSRFVIVADMKSGSITGLEEEINRLGPSHRFTSQAWILISEASLSTIRGALMQKLGKLDILFIVDTTHDKAAWFNFGPQADIKVRKMWARDAELPEGQKEKRSIAR